MSHSWLTQAKCVLYRIRCAWRSKSRLQRRVLVGGSAAVLVSTTWLVILLSRSYMWRVSGLELQVLVLLLVVAVASTLLATLVGNDRQTWQSAALNFGTELAGAVLIYVLIQLVIGSSEVKEQLIADLGSNVNDVAVHAANELRRRGWLTDGSLMGANLIGADLSGADLSGADLGGAYLTLANLHRANLHRANLSGAHLNLVNLSGALLVEANLSGLTDLSNSVLSEADLIEADLSGADLFKADLSGADLFKADLSGAGLCGADLSEADLSEANLSGANLGQAYYVEGNLRERTDLSGADLLSKAVLSSGANLSRANLRGAKVTPEQLAQADSLKDAIMPDGTKHE